MSTLAEYLKTILKIKRNVVDRLAPGTAYSKGYAKAIEDTLQLIEEYDQVKEIGEK